MVELVVQKSADKTYVFMGLSNKIKYSVIITNIGDQKACGVRLKDIICPGVNIVKDSFSVNGCSLNIKNLNKEVSVGSIRPGSNILISYEVEISEINPPSEIINQAIVTYCDENNNMLVARSNVVTIPIINLEVSVCKSVDKAVAKIGEVLNYSVLIRNNSNIPIDNIVFYEDLLQEVELLPGSVLVNLTPQYLESFENGLPLGSLNPYSSSILSFQVKVTELPNPAIICNVARIEFTYTTVISGVPIISIGETCSNSVLTKVINKKTTC